MTVYAKIKSGVPAGPLSLNKEYPVWNEDEVSFYMKDDKGNERFCLWRGCAHLGLDDAEWERIERD